MQLPSHWLYDKKRFPNLNMSETFRTDSRDGKLAIAIFGSIFTSFWMYLYGLSAENSTVLSFVFIAFFCGGWIQLAICYKWPVVWNLVLDSSSLSYFRNDLLIDRVIRKDVSTIDFLRRCGWSPSTHEEHPTIKILLKNGDVHIVSYWRLNWRHRGNLVDAFARLWGLSVLSPKLAQQAMANNPDNKVVRVNRR